MDSDSVHNMRIIICLIVCILQALREGSLAGRVLGRLAVLVLDEADLLLSYGHEADLQAIAPQVPAIPQSWNARRGFLESPAASVRGHARVSLAPTCCREFRSEHRPQVLP
jgi:hypothetical protein